ncbi:hypothetical protein BH20ACT16_BH20ACT16_06880 [soil metagenome]
MRAGWVTTDEDDLAARVRLLRSHGMTTLTWDRHRGHAAGYDVVALGFNYRLDEPRASLGCSRLTRLEDENAQRAVLDARYRDRLGAVVDCTMAPADGVDPAYHLFAIMLAPDVDRDLFRGSLREAGSRRASITRPPTGSRSMPRARPNCPSRTTTALERSRCRCSRT